MEPLFFILVLGVIAVIWTQKTGAGGAGNAASKIVSPAQALSTIQNNTQVQQQIAAAVGQEATTVTYDIESGKAKTTTEVTTGIGIAAGVAATAAADSATGVLIFSASVWTGIGAAVAGIFALIQALRSDTHLYANEIVQKYENPFGAFVIQHYQAVQAGVQNSNLSSADAANITNSVVIAWAQYEDVMQQFQARGGKWNIVATQSLQNLDSATGMDGTFNLNPSLPKTALGNGWMTKVIQQMTAWTQQLQAQGL